MNNHPPPHKMGILDFSKFELSTKFQEPPPHPPTKWEFWILANLNSAPNSTNPHPPPTKWEFWILGNLNSAPNSMKLPPPPQKVGILDFSKFELSTKFHEPLPLPTK